MTGWFPVKVFATSSPVSTIAGMLRAAIGPGTAAHSYASAGRDAKIDSKALSERIGHSDVAFTMRQYVQTDLEVHRQVATALAELILGGVVSVTEPPRCEGNGTDAAT